MRIDIEALSSAYSQVTWGNSGESLEDLVAILGSDKAGERERLFRKFFLEGVSGTLIKALFDREEIKSWLKGMKRPMLRSNQEKRRKVWRHLYLGEHEDIPGFDWVFQRQ